MGFESLGAISRVCHASGGKIRFEVSGPGGKILGLKPLFSLTSSVVMSAKRTPRYVAPHITLFECIRAEMRKGSPEGYNAETGLLEPAQKPQTGEPHERKPLYRIRCTQENHQLLR
jgi:hypothetical protein